jgi:hypothetical protein
VGCHPTQEGDSDDDDEGEGEDEGDEGQIEEDLVSAAADLLPALAGAMGWDAYAPLMCATHGPALLWRLRPAEVLGIRALASGALAEVAEVLGGRVAPLVPKALPTVLRELKAPVRGGGVLVCVCGGKACRVCRGYKAGPSDVV